MHSVCKTCGISKKISKGQNCHSCARILQHKNGVYNAKKLDYSSGYKFCRFCNESHPIIEHKSNNWWLLRNDSKKKYECRKHRKSIYIRTRQCSSKRLRKSVSNLIRDCIAKHGHFKQGSFPKYVEWTVEELKKHLESKFQPGMSWDNYGRGGWHIDHKTPDSWFNYTSMSDEGFKQSWSLENLQPMWENENCSKGNKYIK
jgi:hypothetical protein